MPPIPIALAGYGLGGRVFHAPIIRATDGLRIASVFSPSPETRARAEADLGVTTCATYDELLAGDIELVVIVTPHDTHADLAVRALEGGKHVVVDKVMCLTLDEADRMIDAARAAGRVLTVYQNRRWDGDFLTVRKLLDEGALGEPVVIEARWVRADVSRRASWRLQRARGGGMWLDLGAHMVDQLMLLFGPVASVFCTQDFTEPDLDVATLTECLLTFRSGVTGLIETGALTPIERPRWLVRGTEACYEKYGSDPQEARLREGIVGWPEVDPGPVGRLARVDDGSAAQVPTVPGDWGAFYGNVRDAIRGEAHVAVKPTECRAALEVLLAAEQSARAGEVVHL